MISSRLAGAVVLAGAALLPVACEDDSSPRPPIVVVTPQPVRGIIAQTSFQNFQTDVWVALEVQTSQQGILDVTIDWAHPSSWIFAYFGRTKCDYAQLAGRTCPFLISSETQTPKPRVLVTGTLDAGLYYVVLYNVPKDPRSGIGSDNNESVSVQLGLTVAASGERDQHTIRLGRPTVVPAPLP